jgi:transcription antitermination factor NusG
MSVNSEHFAWYAIQVASRKEKQTATVLSEKGYECFLPLYSKRTMWSDRIKKTTVPLFAGYVFTRLDVRFRLPILVTPYVQGIVGHGKVPVAVSEEDLEAVRTALRNGVPIEPCDSLHHGDAVRVIKGPLAGLEGSFVRYHRGFRLVFSVSLINRSVAVEMDRACVEPAPHQRMATSTGIKQSASHRSHMTGF